MKKLIPSFIVIIMIILSSYHCYAGDCSDPVIDDEQDFYGRICTNFIGNRQGVAIFNKIEGKIARYYKGQKTIIDIYDCVTCEVASEEDFGEEIPAKPFEAYALAG